MKSFNVLSDNIVYSNESAKMNVTIVAMDQNKRKVSNNSCLKVSCSLPCSNLKPS